MVASTANGLFNANTKPTTATIHPFFSLGCSVSFSHREIHSQLSQQMAANAPTAKSHVQRRSAASATSGTLTFQPGQISRTISVAIKGDRKREPNETFTLQLSNAVGATIADGSATVTILNDD